MILFTAILAVHAGVYALLANVLGLDIGSWWSLLFMLSAFMVSYLAWPVWIRSRGTDFEAALIAAYGKQNRILVPVFVMLGMDAAITGMILGFAWQTFATGMVVLVASLCYIWFATHVPSGARTEPR